MEKVEILQDIHIAKSGATYKKGEKPEVADHIAKRHEKSGHMRIITQEPAKPVILEKKK